MESRERISLAMEYGDSSLVPWDDLLEAHQKLLSTPICRKVGEEHPLGLSLLREWMSEAYMTTEHCAVHMEELLLTSGNIQALDLFLRMEVRPGNTVLVESPITPDVIRLLRLHQIKVIPLERSQGGLAIPVIRKYVQIHSPVMIYVTGNGSHGEVWSMERQQQLLALSETSGVLIVEDDSTGHVPFSNIYDESCSSEGAWSSLYSLHLQKQVGHVVSIGCFGRTVLQPLSVGFVRGSRSIISKLAEVKNALRGAMPEWNEQVLNVLLRMPNFSWSEYASSVEMEYMERRELVSGLLEQSAWKGFIYLKPSCGMYAWLQLPEELDGDALLRASLRQGVSFLPGTLCYKDTPNRRVIGFNYIGCGQRSLQLGMDRIAGEIEAFKGRWEQ